MVCPVLCPPIMLGGSFLSKHYGISDLIIGLWSGALVFTLFLVFIRWLDNRGIKFLFRKPLFLFLFFFLSYFPLYYFEYNIYYPKFWVFDEFLLGSIFGIITIISSEIFNNYLIKKNNGKVYFKFQKVIIPIVFLIIASLLIYLLQKILILS
ncbi:MAG: hypothetical protein QXH68_02280 [Candidatus Aenigmatarchaeota archaeon]